MTSHKVAFKTETRPGYLAPVAVKWTCTCGKFGAVYDGRSTPIQRRANEAATRHLKKARS